jgi:hypothetical protein
VPPEPPVELSTILPPVLLHMVPLSTLAVKGSTCAVLTVTIVLAHNDEAQLGASHLAKYVVVVVGTAMVSGVPVPTKVPPQLPLYQVKVPPDPPVAVSTILPVVLLHIVCLSALAEAGAT